MTKRKTTRRSISDSLKRVTLPTCTEFISTGCTLLDLAIAGKLPGGFGVGRISQIYGPFSSAKTVLLAEALGSAQRKGGIAYFEDAERSFDLDRATNLYGLTTKGRKWEYNIPRSIEDLFDGRIADILERREEEDKAGALAVDSLSALPSAKELKAELGEAGYGVTRAKQLSAAFRKYVFGLAEKNLAVLFVDQSRVNISPGFGGDKLVTSGGEALKFYAATRLLVRVTSKLRNKNNSVVGITVGFEVKKNKLSAPMRTGSFRLLFNYGIDDIGTNLDYLKSTDPEKPPSFVVQGNKFRALQDAIGYVEDEKLELLLEEQVAERWEEVHAVPDRKPRRRR